MISFVRPTHRVLGRLGSLLMVLALLVLFVLPAAAYEAGAPDGPTKLIAQPVTSGPGQPIKLEVASIDYGPDAAPAASSRTPEATSFAYDNTVNFLGQVFLNGGAAVQTGNTITRLAADDITVAGGFAGQAVRRFEFSVANQDAATVSARPRVRFYQDNAGVPGTYITGYSFNPIAFPAGVSVLYSTFTAAAPAFTIPASGVFWAGITFDNNTGGTGATLAQMNNFGQGIFNPPTPGSSADLFFLTTAAGSFNVNAPAGALSNFSGNPVANFGWAFASCVATGLTPGSLSNGNVNLPYNATFTQTGGVAPVTFAVIGGALPLNLTLSTGGVLSGTPATAGTYNFTITATDQSTCTDVASYQLIIDPPQAVTLASFDAQGQGDRIVVNWETFSEADNAGFNLYRADDAASPQTLLSYVPSQGPGSTQGFAYTYDDLGVQPGQTYWYWLEDVSPSGATTLHGPVSATVSAPTAVTLASLQATPAAPAIPAAAALLASLAGLMAATGVAVSRRRAR